MMPSCSQTGTPSIAFDGFLHFTSSTTSGSASLMRVRTRASVSPRQSPSCSILASISRAGMSCSVRSFAPVPLFFMSTPLLLIDLRLDQPREISQRLLPAEVARFHGNGVGDAVLHDADLGADGDLLEFDCHVHFARQIGIVELIRVAQALAGHELHILSAERMA